MDVRALSRDDLPALAEILDQTELFPSEMLGEMVAPFLRGAIGDEVWLVCEDADGPIGFYYAEAEMLADAVWNMLALAVSPKSQGRGAGGALVVALEKELRRRAVRVVIVDTSGSEAFCANAGVLSQERLC